MKSAIDDYWNAIHGLDSEKFSLDLLHRVRTAIEHSGYCIFGVKEMERLLSVATSSHTAKAQALRDSATLCGVEVKTTAHLKSAYFHKPL